MGDRSSVSFGFLSEGDVSPGMSAYHRYWELVDEVLFAEKMGFDYFGTSEQHVTIGGASVSSPEILYSYLFGRTQRLRFRHTVTLAAGRINHPLRIAERVATEDILSSGRIELGLGRGNSTAQLRAFEVDLDETRPQLDEAVDLIQKAFTDVPFYHVGKYYKIPPRILMPPPIQQPYPPMFMVATSERSHRMAGEKGVGLLTSAQFTGFERQRDLIRTYQQATDETAASGGHVDRRVAVLVYGFHCAATREQAYRELWPVLQHYLPTVVSSLENMAKYGKTYAYMADQVERLKDILERADGSETFYRELIDGTASFIVGDPDDCAEQIQRFVDLGVDEVWLRVDTLPHETLMKSLELMGKYVIPRFKYPQNIQRPFEENLSLIRGKRPDFEALRGEKETAS